MDPRPADPVETLNSLIVVCADRAEGFRTAAKAARNLELKSLFESYAEQRVRFVAELQEEVRQLGGVPAAAGTLGGTLHRRLHALTSAIGGGGDATTVADSERREQLALAAYEHALRQGLPEQAETLVRGQHAAVREANERLRALEMVTGG